MEKNNEVNSWKLVIEKTTNGYILTGIFGDSDLLSKVLIEIQEGEEQLTERQAMQKIVWELMEYFGVYNSKHNSYNLRIKIVDKDENEIED